MENNIPSNPPFKIGDTVVCVDLTLKENEIFTHPPKVKVGQITTVTSVQYLTTKADSRQKTDDWYIEVSADIGFIYAYYTFALVQPRHQNVEIEKDILEIKIVEERADVLEPEIVNN